MMQVTPEILSFVKFFENSQINAIYLMRLIRDEKGNLLDWKIEYCNEKAADLMDRPIQEFLGKSYREIQPGALESRPDLIEFMDSLSKKGSEWRGIIPSILTCRSYDCTLFSPEDDFIISLSSDISKELKEKDVFREAAYQNDDAVYYMEPVFGQDETIEDFRFVDLNPAAEAQLGYSKDKLIGEKLCKLYPQTIELGILELYVDVFRNKKTVEHEYIAPEGYPIPGIYSLKVARVSDGLLITNKNITEIRKVESQIRIQKEELESTYLASNDGYWNYDMRTEKVFFSNRWKTMLGYSEEEIPNDTMAWRKLVHPKDLRIAFLAFEKHRSSETERFDNVLRYKRKNGEYMFVRSRAVIVRDESGTPVRIVGTHTDITEAKEAELALKRAKEMAEKAYNAKSEFLGMISHEMRTPLYGIAGMAHLLSDTDLDSVQREYLNDLLSSSDILSRLIDDLLQVMTLDSAKIEIREKSFSIQSMMYMIRILTDPRAREKNLHLDLHVSDKVPPNIFGDRTRIEQVLLNLVMNSIKFTEKGSVSVFVDTEENNSIVFKVKDTGIGIEEEARIRIFDAFHQEDLADTRKYKGVGLGLYIAKRLVAQMKGEIRLISKLGEGSEFTVVLPLKVETEAQENLSPLSQLDSMPIFKSGTVLVVDDNEINLKILSKHISKTGLKTDSALSGYEALKILESDEKKYDLIFLDLQMPGMDGYHTADAIHALNSYNSKIPIVAVTASSFAETYEKCSQHGINGFIGKPFEPKQLYKILTEYI